jgi:hypothetical protein
MNRMTKESMLQFSLQLLLVYLIIFASNGLCLLLETEQLSNFSIGNLLLSDAIPTAEYFPKIRHCFNNDLLTTNVISIYASSTGLSISGAEAVSVCRSHMCFDASHSLNICSSKMPNKYKELLFHLALAVWPRNSFVAKNLGFNLEAAGAFGVSS